MIKKQRGFSLMEGMVVVAIIGILVGVAASSSNEMRARQNLKSGVDAVLNVMQYARSEGLKKAGIDCAGSCSRMNWDAATSKLVANGYQGDGTLLDFFVETQPMVGVTLSLNANSAAAAGFDFRGFLVPVDPADNAQMTIDVDATSGGSAATATVSMDNMGRISVCGSTAGFSAC